MKHSSKTPRRSSRFTPQPVQQHHDDDDYEIVQNEGETTVSMDYPEPQPIYPTWVPDTELFAEQQNDDSIPAIMMEFSGMTLNDEIPRESLTSLKKTQKKDYDVKDVHDRIVKIENGVSTVYYYVEWTDYQEKEWIKEEDMSDTAIDSYFRKIKGGIVYIICRVSTKNQTQGYSVSLQAQEHHIKEYAKVHYPNLYVRVVHIVSSAYKRVPKKLKDIVESSEFGDVILVHRVDRFSREPICISDCIKELVLKRVDVISITEKVSLLNNRGDFIREIIRGYDESEALSKRAKASIKYRKENGLYKTKEIPFGKMKEGDRIVVCKQEMTIIMRIKKDVNRALKYGENIKITFDELAREFNNYGLFKRQGNTKVEWTPKMIEEVFMKNY